MDKRSARTTLARAAFGIGWGLFGCAALAQWTPTERITFVSHSSPGTGNDLMLREIADIWVKNKLAPKLVTVENVIFMLIPWMLRRLRVTDGIETEDA